MFTVAEVAKQLRVAERAVLAWIGRGELKAINVARSRASSRPRWRIRQSDLDAFLEWRSNEPPTAKPIAPRRRGRSDAIQFYPTDDVIEFIK